MEILLIRHTAVDVPAGTCYGQADVPLKETFEEEAAVTKATLESFGPVDRAYTSPLSRCTRLAAFCGHADARRDPRILEIDFGEWEMKPFDEIADPQLQAWYADHIRTRVTGGESFMMQYLRVANFLDELRSKSWQRVALFAHGGVLVCAQVYAGLITPEAAFAALPAFGSVIRIEL